MFANITIQHKTTTNKQIRMNASSGSLHSNSSNSSSGSVSSSGSGFEEIESGSDNNYENEIEKERGKNKKSSNKKKEDLEELNSSEDDMKAMIKNYYQDRAVFHNKMVKNKEKSKMQSFGIDSCDDENESHMNGNNRSKTSNNSDDTSMYFVRTELTPEASDNNDTNESDISSIKVIRNYGNRTINLNENDYFDTRHNNNNNNENARDIDEIDESGLWNSFRTAFSRFFKLVTVPFEFVFERTIPKVRNENDNEFSIFVFVLFSCFCMLFLDRLQCILH